MPVVDPDLVRGLGVGQVAYVHQGGVSYIQVKRVVGAPAALPRVEVTPPAPVASPASESGAHDVAHDADARELVTLGAFLDEAFGPREPA